LGGAPRLPAWQIDAGDLPGEPFS
jgi:uncharacterized protein (DUF1810 family)